MSTTAGANFSRDIDLSEDAARILGVGGNERLAVSVLLGRVVPELRERLLALLNSPDVVPDRLRLSLPRFDTGEPRTIDFALRGAFDPGRARIGRWGTLTDVTDLATTETQLRDAHQILSAGLEAVADGVVVLNADGTLHSLNGPARRLLGEPADGSSIWDSFPGLRADPIWREFREVVERGSQIEEERFVLQLAKEIQGCHRH